MFTESIATFEPSARFERIETRSIWHALTTRGHCEQLTFDRLVASGLRPFLPKMRRWTTDTGWPRRVELPMFPGYLFLHGVIDAHARVAGVWDRLIEVPEHEMAAVLRLAAADAPLHAHPFLRDGTRVRIQEGPLAGIEGVMVPHRAGKHLVIVSLEALRRSVAVEVDCAYVQAA